MTSLNNPKNAFKVKAESSFPNNNFNIKGRVRFSSYVASIYPESWKLKLKPKESLEQIYNYNRRIYLSFDKIYLCLPV